MTRLLSFILKSLGWTVLFHTDWKIAIGVLAIIISHLIDHILEEELISMVDSMESLETKYKAGEE